MLGDRAYDAEYIRHALRTRQILPRLAMRNTKHGSGLGRWRWLVEPTFAWLNQFRRLRMRYETARHALGFVDSRVHSDLLEVPTNSTAVVARLAHGPPNPTWTLPITPFMVF